MKKLFIVLLLVLNFVLLGSCNKDQEHSNDQNKKIERVLIEDKTHITDNSFSSFSTEVSSLFLLEIRENSYYESKWEFSFEIFDDHNTYSSIPLMQLTKDAFYVNDNPDTTTVKVSFKSDGNIYSLGNFLKTSFSNHINSAAYGRLLEVWPELTESLDLVPSGLMNTTYGTTSPIYSFNITPENSGLYTLYLYAVVAKLLKFNLVVSHLARQKVNQGSSKSPNFQWSEWKIIENDSASHERNIYVPLYNLGSCFYESVKVFENYTLANEYFNQYYL